MGFAPWQLARAYDRDRFPGVLPVFPLGGITFFPHTLLPLHIFEPRYQEMVRDCLGSEHEQGGKLGASGLIAVASVAVAGAPQMPPLPGEDAGERVSRVVGFGQIVAYQPLEDGRSNVVLVGVGRARLDDWVDHGTSYAQARAELLAEPRVRPSATRSARRLKESLEEAGRRVPELSRLPGVEQLDDPEVPLEVVLDHLCSLQIMPPGERQGLLECEELPLRARLVAEALALAIGPGGRASPGGAGMSDQQTD